MEIFCSLLVAERHVVLGFVLICFAVSFFPLMAYCHLIRRICFNLLRGLLFFTHGISPRHSTHLFYFASRIFFTSCTPPAARLLFLHIKCFLLSQVSCCPCAPGAPPIAELQKIAKQTMSSVQTKMAFRPHRATTDREANNVQCADQNGVPPPPNNNRPRSE